MFLKKLHNYRRGGLRSYPHRISSYSMANLIQLAIFEVSPEDIKEFGEMTDRKQLIEATLSKYKQGKDKDEDS